MWPTAHQQTYTYNARGQVTGITDWTGIGAGERSNGGSFGYDDLGRLKTFTPAAATLPARSYAYDKWGNITNKAGVELQYPDPTVPANPPHQTNNVRVGQSAIGTVVKFLRKTET